MKNVKQKLLSMLTVIAIMCSLVPTAMAYNSSNQTVVVTPGGSVNVSAYFPAQTTYNGWPVTFSGYVTWDGDNNGIGVSGAGSSAVISADSAAYTGSQTTVVASGVYYLSGNIPYNQPIIIDYYYDVTVGGNNYVSGNGGVSSSYYAQISNSTLSVSVNGTASLSVSPMYGSYAFDYVSWESSDPQIATVSGSYGSSYATVTGVSSGQAVITASVYDYDYSYYSPVDQVSCVVTVGSGLSNLYITSSTQQLTPNGTSGVLQLTTYDSTLNYYLTSGGTVTWTSSNSSVAYVTGNGSYAYVYGQTAGQATITASLYYGSQFMGSASYTVTVGSGYGNDTGHFYLSSSSLQLLPNGNYEMLSATPYPNSGVTADQLQNLTWYSSDPNVVAVYNYSNSYNSGYAVGSYVYVYGVGAGTATITAYLDNTCYAVCNVTVGNGGTGVDVVYSLTTGQSLALDTATFQDFWEDTYYRGTLDYVVFGSASGNVGRLVYDRSYNYGYGSSTQTTTPVGSNYFYASPAYNQYGINAVTFTPSSTTSYSTGTLTVPFTAYGSTSYSDTSVSALSGTMYIVVTNGAVQDITYDASSASVELDPADFVSVYKQALNVSSTYPTVYIQFLDTPDFGDLYYNYGSNYYSSGTKLTSSNIDSMRFSTNSAGAYGIDDVTYVPGSAKSADSIRYAAFSSASGGTLLYVGEIVIEEGAETVIKYHTALNTAVDLSGYTFLSGNEELYTTEYITFGTPSSGTLYKDYANGTGTRVTSNTFCTLSSADSSSAASVNDLTFVPGTNYTGIVEIPFTAYNILGKEIDGTVKIYIAKKFSDVAATNWAYKYITELTAQGIVDGMTTTTFAPAEDLKYGEALKLIMEAVGYSSQVKTGTHWASGYLTAAYRDGLVVSNTIDLESKIDRTTVAEIAARALGMSKASDVDAGVVKPVDSTNGYVYALYNAGILTGEYSGGKNYYNGADTLTRAQVCAIVCRISDYNR